MNPDLAFCGGEIVNFVTYIKATYLKDYTKSQFFLTFLHAKFRTSPK